MDGGNSGEVLVSEKIKTLTYKFKLESGVEKVFTIRLKLPSLDLITHPPEHPPDWTRLTFNQCPNCPLDPATHARCPVALNLVELLDFFRDLVSIEVAEITVSSEQREIHKKAAVQYGVSSLMGLYMVTSGCPIMDKLRPMVSTHLPFANVDETLYRAMAMYLVAQFLIHKRGGTPDWDLKDLVATYDEVGRVNKHFIHRLLSMSPKDSSLNALGSLDCFASYTAVTLEDNFLEDLEELFAIYLNKPR